MTRTAVLLVALARGPCLDRPCPAPTPSSAHPSPTRPADAARHRAALRDATGEPLVRAYLDGDD